MGVFFFNASQQCWSRCRYGVAVDGEQAPVTWSTVTSTAAANASTGSVAPSVMTTGAARCSAGAAGAATGFARCPLPSRSFQASNRATTSAEAPSASNSLSPSFTRNRNSLIQDLLSHCE